MKKKLTVAILIDTWFPFTGGAQRQVQESTKIWQEKKKLEFKIFSSFTPNPFLRFFWLFYVIPQVCYYHFLKKRFDLIHAHAFLAGLPAKFLSLILGVPLVFTIHGTGIGVWEKMEKGIRGKVKKEIEKLILFKIKYNAQISVSSDIMNLPNVNKNIFIIPNGVKVGDFDRIKVKKAPGFKILFVGRLHPQKGLVYLIKALSFVVKEHPQVSLHLIGEGTLEKSLKRKAKDLGLQKYIHFKGRVTGKRLIREYKSSHLFVLPSLYEGQPLTLLEAWAAKLPVVVTSVGENACMVKEGVNGCLVEPASTRNLYEKLKQALTNDTLYRLGEKGYRLVKAKFGWPKVAEEIFAVYEKTIS